MSFTTPLFITSCWNRTDNPFDFSNRTENVYELVGVKKNIPEIISPHRINRKGNFLIVTEDGKIPLDKPIIHILDIESLELKVSKGINGYGPNEITDAFLFDAGFSDSTFWVNSTISKRMAEFSLFNNNVLSEREFRQPEAMFTAFNMQMTSDSTFLCFVADDTNRLVEFNNKGKRLGGYGDWEKIDGRNDLDNFLMLMINGGWFTSNHDQNIFVKAGAYRDRIEIFEYDTKSFTIIDGPRLEIPPFNIKGSGKNRMAAFPIETKYGHRDISIQDRYIYDLYSGFSELDYRKDGDLAKTIYVLTRKGDVTAKFNLDKSVKSIAVDESKGKIYAISTDEETGIIVFDIPKKLLSN
ncbi:BF3164 family lipoprotein [Roseivirga sp. UBA838]|uniref:BF3164 family lipoprotein n=1 Tax=Roseivirga sp. UBA838 TaxID=1947393 RepID=UPI00257F9080|nr:BF3164 family lipoprotein [Roseivirga sp. UBA838]